MSQVNVNTDGGDRGGGFCSGITALIAIILLIVVVLVVLWATGIINFNPGAVPAP